MPQLDSLCAFQVLAEVHGVCSLAEDPPRPRQLAFGTHARHWRDQRGVAVAAEAEEVVLATEVVEEEVAVPPPQVDQQVGLEQVRIGFLGFGSGEVFEVSGVDDLFAGERGGGGVFKLGAGLGQWDPPLCC